MAVWFSLAGTPLLAVGLYLPASGQPEAYEPILRWALAHIVASARYLHVVSIKTLGGHHTFIILFPMCPDCFPIF